MVVSIIRWQLLEVVNEFGSRLNESHCNIFVLCAQIGL